MERKSRRRPSIFSRGQLRLLIWVLPSVILILSLLGPEPETGPSISTNAERSIYQQVVPQQTHFKLHLIAAQEPILSAVHQLRQRLIQQALLQRLQAADELGDWLEDKGWSIQLQDASGYRRLTLTSLTPFDSEALHDLLLRLQRPPAVDWEALLRRVQAEQYLVLQTPEFWLQSQTPTPTPEHVLDPVAEYRQQLIPDHWRLTLTGPESLPLTLPTQHIAAPDADASPRLTLKPLSTQAPLHKQSITLQLHRWSLPPPDSPSAFAMSLLARELVLQRLSLWLEQHLVASPSHQTGFSLRWEPAAAGGAASLLLQGDVHLDLPVWLPAQVLQADLVNARTALLAQIDKTPDKQQWMDLLALYQLPAQSLSQLPDLLSAIEPQAIHDWLQHQLQSDYYHTLSLPQ